MSTKCSNCGMDIVAGSKFCDYCGKAIEVRAVCRQCGADVTPGDKFCSKCGTGSSAGTAAAEAPVAAGSTSASQAPARAQLFPNKAHLMLEAAQAVQKYLTAKKLVTQIVQQGASLVIQGKQPSNLLKSALGLDAAITVKLSQQGANLTAEFGAGKWLDKVAGVAIGWFIAWPAMLTAGYGYYAQKRLLAGVEDHLRNYILHSH